LISIIDLNQPVERKLKFCRFLHDMSLHLADALGMKWPVFAKLLSVVWSKRRKAKAKRLRWVPDDEIPAEKQGRGNQSIA
jgi:hypothetical protein